MFASQGFTIALRLFKRACLRFPLRLSENYREGFTCEDGRQQTSQDENMIIVGLFQWLNTYM